MITKDNIKDKSRLIYLEFKTNMSWLTDIDDIKNVCYTHLELCKIELSNTLNEDALLLYDEAKKIIEQYED